MFMVNMSLCNNKFCKWIFLGALCCASNQAFSETLEKIVSVSESKKFHKLPPQQFVIFMENPNIQHIKILVKRKIKYRLDMSKEERLAYAEERNKIHSFITSLKGKISVNWDKSLEYAVNFPTPELGGGGTYYDANGNEWESITYPGFIIKGTGDYVISSEFYSNSDEFDDYMIALTRAYGTK